MKRTSYQIYLPQDTQVVVFYNGLKALSILGWLWKQIFTAKFNTVIDARGCLETKLCICSPVEVVIVSYWLDEQSLLNFFHSPLHRQMMKSMMQIITADRKAIGVFNETYRPIKSGRYLNEPQGLAKIYPAMEQEKAATS